MRDSTIVRAARARHDGYRRDPWNEVEFGHHYIRSMAGWAVYLALTGVRSDMVDRELSIEPPSEAATFRTFWCTGRAWGTYAHTTDPATGQVEMTVETLYGDLHGIDVRGPGGRPIERVGRQPPIDPGCDERTAGRPAHGSQRRSAAARRAGIGRAGTATRSRSSPGRRCVLAQVDAPGVVRHIWMTAASDDPYHLRTATLRAYWDGAATPVHRDAARRLLRAGPRADRELLVAAAPDEPAGRQGAELLVPDAVRLAPGSRSRTRAAQPLTLYYYIDYEVDARPTTPSAGRFHARWHREDPTEGIERAGLHERRLPVRRREPGRGRQLRDPGGDGRGPLRRVPPRHRQSQRRRMPTPSTGTAKATT